MGPQHQRTKYDSEGLPREIALDGLQESVKCGGLWGPSLSQHWYAKALVGILLPIIHLTVVSSTLHGGEGEGDGEGEEKRGEERRGEEKKK